MMEKDKCGKGQPCGKTCINRSFECRQKTLGPDVNASLAAITNLAKSIRDLGPRDSQTIRNNQIKKLSEASKISDADLKRKLIVEAAMLDFNSHPPEEAKSILNKKIKIDTKDPLYKGLPSEVTLEEYGEWVSKQEWYRAETNWSTGSISKGIDRKGDDFRKYYVPGSKLREVSDDEVDAVWEKLTQEDKVIFIGKNKGAPDRVDDGENRYKVDWDNDYDRMYKEQLRTILQQVVVNPDGTSHISSPFSPDGVLRGIADLDHIVPVSKGGTHGPLDGVPNKNWVYIEARINRATKKNSDIVETVEDLKKAAYGYKKKNAEEYYKEKLNKNIQHATKKFKADESRIEIENLFDNEDEITNEKIVFYSKNLPSIIEISNALVNKGYISNGERTRIVNRKTPQNLKRALMIDILSQISKNRATTQDRIIATIAKHLKDTPYFSEDDPNHVLYKTSVVPPVNVIRVIHNLTKSPNLSQPDSNILKKWILQIRPPEIFAPKNILKIWNKTNGNLYQLEPNLLNLFLDWLYDMNILPPNLEEKDLLLFEYQRRLFASSPS